MGNWINKPLTDLTPRRKQAKTFLKRTSRHQYKLTQEETERIWGVESLDFTQIDNSILREFNHRATKWWNVQKTLGKWIICFFIGLVTGAVSYGIASGVRFLDNLKFNTTDIFVSKGWYLTPFLIYFSFNLAFCIMATVISIIFGKLSSGAGVADVKAFLNGIRIPHTVNLKTFVGKVLSLIFSYSSGLALGPEGPMVHIGSIIGGGMGQVQSRAFKFSPKSFVTYRNHRDQRDFLTSGAAAGLTAAFGAPVGGVLYSLEETTSYWSRQLTWRTFFACMIASFTVNLFEGGFTNSQAKASYGLITFGISNDYLYHRYELIPFCLLGMLSGLVGALFVALNTRLNKWRHDSRLQDSVWKSLFEVVLVITLTSIVTFWVPAAFGCRSYNDITDISSSSCGTNTTDTPVEMYCPKGHFNDLASLFYNAQHSSLQLLFSRVQGLFSMTSLALFAFIYFILSVLTAGLYLAGGLFIPLMLVGAAFGRFLGELIALIFPTVTPPIDPSIYALIGSGAMVGAFSRMTMSIVVILVELTGDTQYLLPIMAAVMMAKWIGDIFNEPLYEAQLKMRHVPFLYPQPPYAYLSLTVRDIMAVEVVCFREVEKVRTIFEVLSNTEHNGFPVVMGVAEDETTKRKQAKMKEEDVEEETKVKKNTETELPLEGEGSELAIFKDKEHYHYAHHVVHPSSALDESLDEYVADRGSLTQEAPENKLFRGLILRNQLLILLHHRKFQQNPHVSVEDMIPYETFVEELNHVVKPISTVNLTEEQMDMYIDLRPCIHCNICCATNTFRPLHAS